VTASSSESFGLTLLEAAQAGTLLLGLDAPYGSSIFIQDEWRVSWRYGKNAVPVIADYAEKITQILRLTDQEKESLRRQGREVARDFTISAISARWKAFFESLRATESLSKT